MDKKWILLELCFLIFGQLNEIDFMICISCLVYIVIKSQIHFGSGRMNSIKQSTMVGSRLCPFLKLSRACKYDKANFLEVAMCLEMVACPFSILHNFTLKFVPSCLYLITRGVWGINQADATCNSQKVAYGSGKETIVKTAQLFVRLGTPMHVKSSLLKQYC